MDRQTFNTLITKSDFKTLFIEELGWNKPEGQTQLPDLTIGETTYRMTCVAQLSGFQVLTCATDQLPAMTLCRTIDSRLRRQANDYICIFTHTGEPLHHLWLCPIVTTEKRDTVIVEYTTLPQADFLYQKMQQLYFALGETVTIVDVKQRVQQAFAVNSERITKDFYRGFRQQHQAFADFITGIDDHLPAKDNRQKQWYTSVMLNRLMFCYFIQKKGFLDQDTDYLANKLRWVKQEHGADRFYQSFYRGFLLRLFHGGLNQPTHDDDFEDRYGRIPYLNGGMFDLHRIERQYPDIDISDEAFERLFSFFDQWQWHLDTRITATGRDINPDVLGYIFEQYINDRAAMGAYYTKEDITEYIAKNCILPFLLDQVRQSPSGKHFKNDGYVWQTMRDSGTRYIYDAVLRGYSTDWQTRIPDYIAQGISTTEPNLLERRKRWNERTQAEFALPTEIWRETIERLQRCDMLMTKISGGEVHEANDLITLNLNIRLFAQDLIDRADDHLFVKHFYHALRRVTILDPTCGSGAFLFAALNILEPLYEACIERMRLFNEQNGKLFVEELAEIDAKYRSNVQYFIYKSIILRNLYGVDIMAEATEIAKLRLFLKMVAVVDVAPDEPNLGLDPLPDVDFNIRCGNTLVGYANKEDVLNSVKYGDMFAKQEFEERIEGELDSIAKTYQTFKALQLTQEENAEAYKDAKQQLTQRLRALNGTLNQQLHQATAAGTDYNAWLATHQPFHWIAEFYDIIHGNGGFDVIIGNPPYVEYRKKDKVTKKSVEDQYKLTGYRTIECGNLYAYVLERSKAIMSGKAYMGMIVPLSGHSTERMSPLVTNFYKKFGLRLHLNLSADANPQRLFEGVKFRLAIFFVSNTGSGHYSSKYTRWLAEERPYLFSALVKYNDEQDYAYNNVIGKIPGPLYISAIKKMRADKGNIFANVGNYECLYHNAPVNWIRAHSFVPYFFSERDGEKVSVHLKKVKFGDEDKMKVGTCILCSSVFFIWWITNSDCYDLISPDITNLKYTYTPDATLSRLADDLAADMKSKSRRRVYVYRATGRVEYDEFYMKLSKPIIDEIDKALAKHYGFTDEELDFIINYDIKYRMGEELNADADE